MTTKQATLKNPSTFNLFVKLFIFSLKLVKNYS